jgi:DNA invertase Pin-like site-specific DNA recombinase
MAEKGSKRPGRLRCAIYTRKSSDEGLEQEFNSLHAQREACEAYILSQRHEGWHVLSPHYDDGGYSGGTMDRPALQRLLADIGAGKVDVVVVYKIDRLTRSLFDFAKIVETFDAKGVSFVSVTQQFNTTTSMGRLTLNVLLSFAQFEREIIAERVRDKIAASKQKGMWMGGTVPLGYDAIKGKLRINEQEAKTVRLLFELYLKLGSVRRLQEECQRLGLRTKLRTLLDGRQSGGTAFSRGHLYLIISNQIYIGRIPHKGRSYEGEHDAIIDAETWGKVRGQLAMNARRKRGRTSSKHPSLLSGLLFTAEGVPFTPSHAVNHGRRYRYYIERSLLTPEAEKGESGAPKLNDSGNGVQTRGWRLPAHEIEQLVLNRLACILRDRAAVLDAVGVERKAPDVVSAMLAHASKLAGACESGSFASHLEIITALVRRVTIAQDRVMIEIDHIGLVGRLLDRETTTKSSGKVQPPIQIEVPVGFRRRGVEAKLVVLSQHPTVSVPDTNLLKALARAHEWWGRIARGEATGIADIARAEGFNRAYVTRFLCLAFLAPETIKAILEGRHPTELTAKRLVSSALKIPLLWRDQASLVGPRLIATTAAGSIQFPQLSDWDRASFSCVPSRPS